MSDERERRTQRDMMWEVFQFIGIYNVWKRYCDYNGLIRNYVAEMERRYN